MVTSQVLYVLSVVTAWYFPDGRIVEFGVNLPRFLANRGPNEVINGQQFYGSVRLFRRFSNIPERGRFRCELPSAANPSVNQIIYVNICEFMIIIMIIIIIIIIIIILYKIVASAFTGQKKEISYIFCFPKLGISWYFLHVPSRG